MALQIEIWPQTVAQFECLVEATRDELVNFAFHQIGNHDDAEDVVQDVYVQAYRDRSKRQSITDVRPYLFRMVRNRCIDLHRYRQRRPSELGTDQLASSEDIFSTIAAREQSEKLNRLLDGIPGREAEVVRLRAFSELSFAEIAIVVDAPVPTVKSRFRYGLGKLRALHAEGEIK